MPSGRARAIAGGLAAALAFALPSAATAQDPGPAYSDWNAELPGYPSNAERSVRAECVRGGDACIDRTIAEMWRRFHTVVPSCDDNNVFSLTYLRVTEDIRRGVDEGFYEDEVWLNRLDSLFARPYFLAYDNFYADRIALVPPAWRIAFDAGRNGEVEGIGNLLLSMNAHINRDFPFVLYQAGLTDEGGESRKPAHDSGNSRLRALYKPMLAELSARFDASIDDYDVPGTEVDDEAIFQVLVDWREAAWQNAVRLANAANDAERRQVAASIEDYATSQAEAIYAGSAYGPGESTAARDALCAEAGGQRPRYRRGSDVAKFASPRATRRGERMAVRVRCPDGPGPCVGTARAGTGRSRFSIAAGEVDRVLLPASSWVGGGRRIGVKLRSLLEPGTSAIRRRSFLAPGG